MALQSSTVWEVRTTGTDSNGGGFAAALGGTDYSQQDAPQVAFTDLVIGATTTQLTSAANPFTSAHVGNILNVTGGTNFTTGRYQIAAVASGVATMDRAVGTAAATGGAGNLGGALASPGMAAAAIVASNTVWIRSGTYTCSATANVAGGRPQPAFASRWIGYVATRGDAQFWGTLPSLAAGASGMTIFTPAAGSISIENLEFNGQTGTYTSTIGVNASTGWFYRAVNCRVKNTTGDGFSYTGTPVLFSCEAVGCGGTGFNLGGGFARRCLARSCSIGFGVYASGILLSGCAAYGNTSDGFASVFALLAQSCSSTANGRHGFNLDAPEAAADNCVAWANGGYGYSSSARYDVLVLNCAGGSNTSGNFNGTNIPAANITNFIPLTASPFVNAATFNFALNTAAGGGAALRGAGNGAGPGLGSVGYPDVGAVQHQDNSLSPPGGMSKGRLLGGI